MHQPQVATVISGATREAQLDANAEAVDLVLTADILRDLDEASEDFIYDRGFGSAPKRRS